MVWVRASFQQLGFCSNKNCRLAAALKPISSLMGSTIYVVVPDSQSSPPLLLLRPAHTDRSKPPFPHLSGATWRASSRHLACISGCVARMYIAHEIVFDVVS